MAQLTYQTLVQRLDPLDENVRKEVIAEVTKPKIQPATMYEELPYLKEDLTTAIREYFLRRLKGENDVDLGEALDEINKEPLKRVYYGILSFPNTPRPFLSALRPWERVYFFAGAWREKKTKEDLDPLTLVEMSALYLKGGIAGLAIIHNYHKVHATSYGRKFMRVPSLPFAARIQREIEEGIKTRSAQRNKVQQLSFADVPGEKKLEDLFAEEARAPTPEVAERIAIMLDSCSDVELAELTQKYGAQRLGGYARK